MNLPCSSIVNAVVIAGSFVISSNELVSVIVRLIYPGFHGRYGMVWRYLSSLPLEDVCAAVSLVPYVLRHAIEEVWSRHHEASFSDCFDHTASL